MRALTLHLKILITVLVCIGVFSIAYQIFVLKIPVTENEKGNYWTIDAKIDFFVRGSKPVKVQFFIPSAQNGYIRYIKSTDSIIAKDYGSSIEDDGLGNQLLTLSSRRESGLQTLYYRLALTQRDSLNTTQQTKGSIWRESIPLTEQQQVAAKTLIDGIRQKSLDTSTFITATIKAVSDTKNDNVSLLLDNNDSVANKVNVIDLLLSQAHIPIQRVHTLRLIQGINQKPELWIRSYIESTVAKNTVADKKDANATSSTGKWVYFNPETGKVGLPNDRIIWWVGDNDLLTVDNGSQARVTFSIGNSELLAKGIISQMAAEKEASSFLTYSLYSLPIQVQETYMVMIMIPIGVLVILIWRNIVGLQTLGTFTPVLIALAFRETGLGFGICLFSIIVALGLSVRSYLEHLKLQMLPRLSVVLTFVVILIAAISLFSHKLGLEQGLSVTLFPMVILTMTIERLSITWEERGGATAFKVGIGTLCAASLAYLIMKVPTIVYFVFTFPGILLILVGFMLAMGRYRGYRLTELVRFKALLKEG
ncbi:hypothetical protein DKL61_07375 [Gammaproteobacteria bacterium ESL0073]|nr:hypothetical protein DKL61_07375 [Gammaproteobacteria bacterium ESL0073]